MNWLRKVLRKWLGIEKVEEDLRTQEKKIYVMQKRIIHLEEVTKNLVSIGVDVHFTSTSMILIYSRLNGGQIREIKADFSNMQELSNFVRELKQRFNTDKVIIDTPHRGARF